MYSGFQDNNLKVSMEELSYPYPQQHHNLELEMELEMEMEMEQQQLRFDMESYGNSSTSHLIHDPGHLILSLDHEHNHNHNHNHNNNWVVDPPALNLLHLPRFIPSGGDVFDPLFHLNLPPQPPIFGYTFLPDATTDTITHVDGDGDGIVIGRKPRRGRIAKPYPTERDRRNHLSGKYTVLRSLVPNPTKVDRASIVSDAIGYIKELLATVDRLKALVEKKRERRERLKKRKREEDGCGDGEVESSNPDAHSYTFRTSCLHRQSKDTEVDVRLVDDEVTIKLVRRNDINCLLLVSKALDELHLDLHHVAGGNFGDYCTFMFNTKMQEGSSAYASVIANKLVEVMDAQYAGIAPAAGY